MWEEKPGIQTYFTIDVETFTEEGRDDNMQACQDLRYGMIVWDIQTQTLLEAHLEIKTNIRVYVTLMA